ncbi:MAG: hypothetical protein AAB116_06675, partial [Candidatus Poribacteria bacterium]
MAVQVSYPGVYVQEVPSGVRTIVGVSTSIALFIGRTKQGPLNKPIQCFNYSDFERTFSSDSSVSDMPNYVKLFFMNGGTQCYVMRIANGATAAQVTLRSEDGISGVLVLTAKQVGLIGETIRTEVTYSGRQPEATFNMKIFRNETDNATGRQVQKDIEEWKGLSMDPSSTNFAPDYLTQNSKLVDAALAAGIPVAVDGFSRSGRPVFYNPAALPGTPEAFPDAWANLIGNTRTTNQFQISVDGSRYITADLSSIDVAGLAGPNLIDFINQLASGIKGVIEQEFVRAGYLGITVEVSIDDGPDPGPNFPTTPSTSLLRISSENEGDVYILPSTNNDVAVPLMLGTDQGGLEISAHANRRPAPNGITMRANDPAVIQSFAELEQGDVSHITLSGIPLPATNLVTTVTDDPMFRDNINRSLTDHNDGIRQKLGIIRDAINDYRANNPRTFFWKSELWGLRLAILPTNGNDNDIGTLATSATNLPVDIPNSFTRNVRRYSVGNGGTGNFQSPAATLASDGNPPLALDYDSAYNVVDKEINLFNLMILPPDKDPHAVPVSGLYGPASVFCQKRRAFLLMDSPANWSTAQIAVNGDSQNGIDGIDGIRTGLIKDYSAIFYPRVTIKENGLKRNIG